MLPGVEGNFRRCTGVWARRVKRWGATMADSGADGLGLAIEEMRAEHVENAGRALYAAFHVDSCATGVPPTYSIASPEAGSTFLDCPAAARRVQGGGSRQQRKSGGWGVYAEWYASCLGHVAPQVLDHSFFYVWMHGHFLPV